MRSVAILAGVLALGAASSSAAPASDSSKVVAEAGAWYSNASTTALGTTTVASGEFPVGRGAHGEDKRSYLRLQLPQSTLSAIVRLRVSSAGLATFGAPGTIHACLVMAPWSAGSGGDLATAPAIDCMQPVAGKTEGGKMSFDLSPFVLRWSTGLPNQGIALVASADQPLPWQVSFAVSQDEAVGTATVGALPGGAPMPAPAVSPSEPTVPTTVAAPLPVIGPAIDAFPVPVAELPYAPSVSSERPSAPGPLRALPVNVAVWLLVPGGLLVLYACARALGRSGEPRSPLDHVLP